jgi:hypothetical protein
LHATIEHKHPFHVADDRRHFICQEPKRRILTCTSGQLTAFSVTSTLSKKIVTFAHADLLEDLRFL